MLPQAFKADTVKEAVSKIIPYLEDTSDTALKAIYFEGWWGLAASAVLKDMADNPPASLRKKFDKIIHIDCSIWKSRRALQRAIAEKLKLAQWTLTALDMQDEEDDFSGVHKGSRKEISAVARAINETLKDSTFLVLFHNGSDQSIDLAVFGLPRPEWFSASRVFWTFRGRLHLDPKVREKVDSSQLFLESFVRSPCTRWAELLEQEAREIALYARKLCPGVNHQMSMECCLYLLILNHGGGNIMDYNWTTHASNYWVCDGIVKGDQHNHAWEVARAVHQQIRIEDYSLNTLPGFAWQLESPLGRWMLASNNDMEHKLPCPKTTSFFLGHKSGSNNPLPSLPNKMFHSAAGLHVLKLCRCSFNFSSPPFHCCQNLRFLGLDSCIDSAQIEDCCTDQQIGERSKYGLAFEVFQRLWVLDMRYTDWELASPLGDDKEEKMAINIREVHIRKGRMWHDYLPWRKLQNLHKLCIVEPTRSWETGKKDEFKDMVTLESLDISDSTVQALSFSGPNRLKTLFLDGCIRLESIRLTGCSRLADITLCGPLPKLEELELSHTSVTTLDLKEVVEAQHLQRIILMGCKKLRSILWPEKTKTMKQLRLLCIDTRGEEGVEKSHLSFVQQEQKEYCHAFVAVTDMRFLQSLLVLPGIQEGPRIRMSTDDLKLHLYLSSTSEDGKICGNENRSPCYSTEILVRSPLYKLSMAKTCYSYSDVRIEQITSKLDGCTGAMFQPPQDIHIEIGQGTINTKVVNVQGIRGAVTIMNNAKSLHAHDNPTITSVIPNDMICPGPYHETVHWPILKWCRVERCPELDNVFSTTYHHHYSTFKELEIFFASDLLKASFIWKFGTTASPVQFENLRAVHLHFCPRLIFVLPLSVCFSLMNLENLDIVWCGDLRQVFPVEHIEKKGDTMEFPKLKSLHLHELPKLQQICEAKMLAPRLETIYIRGCWSLRRLPSTDPLRQGGRPVAVDCEKDWWDNLEWDGLDAGHQPSLFAPHHSAYYKKKKPLRGSVLR